MQTPNPKLLVIKIGGNVLDNPFALQEFLKNISSIKVNKILIHGGGKIASEIGKKLGIEPIYNDGRRVTNKETLDLVSMVFGGLINKQIVAKLQALGCNAIGLTGADANLLPANKRSNTPIDFGFVGNPIEQEANFSFLHYLLQQNMVPIIAPLTHDKAGTILNTNADTVAASIAVALSKYYTIRLIYCFEKRGVLENINDEESVIPKINQALFEKLLQEKKLFAGIIPKIQNALEAIQKGVHQVLIGDANDLLANLGNNTIGTIIEN